MKRKITKYIVLLALLALLTAPAFAGAVGGWQKVDLKPGYHTVVCGDGQEPALIDWALPEILVICPPAK